MSLSNVYIYTYIYIKFYINTYTYLYISEHWLKPSTHFFMRELILVACVKMTDPLTSYAYMIIHC